MLRALEVAAGARLRIRRIDDSLDRDSLLAEARARTGLRDFGEEGFREGLDRLLESCGREARLTALGRLSVRGECLRILGNRLTLIELRKASPELFERPIRRPVFVVGLPRSGTTLLHTYLDAVPGHRAPRLWEMLAPAHAATEGRPRPSHRSALRWLRVVDPGLAGIHDVRLEAPEECTFLFQHTFRSFLFGAALHTPSYVDWLVRQDMTESYAWHRRLLSLLARSGDETRWILKSPAHCFSLGALMRAYPDAVVLHLHRDPAEVLASFCSLRERLLRLTTRDVDRRDVGKYSLLALRVAATSAMQARAGIDPHRVVDVRFEALMDDPPGTCARLLDALAVPERAAAGAAIADRIERTPPRRGRHRPSLERYGLDRAAIERHFRPYLAWSDEVTAH